MMNLFDKSISRIELLAPVNGKTISLENLDDVVFSSKMMGDGIAFDHHERYVSSPCDGKIILIANTLHAFGIRTKNGAEILIHIGFNTTELNGKGFTKLVKQGENVKKGTPIIEIDIDYMKTQNISLLTPMVVTNGKHYQLHFINENQDVQSKKSIVGSIIKG